MGLSTLKNGKKFARMENALTRDLLIHTGFFLLFHKGSTVCVVPLGMEKGHIKDEDITASSAFDFKSVGPHLARLDQDLDGGAWCPKKVIGK